MDRDPFDLVGDVLEGQFRVLEFAGEGDLSVVYKGHHLGVDAAVAIKCLNLPATLDLALVEPLIESFREASRLHYLLAQGNLNIAQSLASGTTLAPRTGAHLPYLVREWFEGESLGSDLKRRAEQGSKGRSIGGAIKLLEPAVEGVAYAHTQGVVHLSLHPSNLFLSKRGDQSTLKVLDFGVARTMNELAAGLPPVSPASKGLRVLFPAYAAPEQLDTSVGLVGPATDVYALALVIMEVLSDRPVMAGLETGALVERALDKATRPTPRAHGLLLPKGIDAALVRAVSRDPEKRQKNVATFWNEVRAALKASSRAGGGTSSVPPPSDDAVEVALSVLTEHRPRAATLMGIAPAGIPIEGVKGTAVALSPPSAPPRSPSRWPSTAESGLGPAPASVGEVESEAARARYAPAIAPPPLPPKPVPSRSLPPRPTATVATAPSPAPAAAPLLAPAPPAPAFPPVYAFGPPPAPLPAPRRRLSLPFIVQVHRIPPAILVALVIVVPCAISVVYAVVLVNLHGRPKPAPSALTAPPPIPSALPSAPAPSAPPPVDVSPVPSAPEPAPRFNPSVARHALDAVSRDVLHCRKGKAWGTAPSTVTFANDGSVSRVVVGSPFRGTTTGQCVSELLSSVTVPPFTGKGVLDYRFFVKEPPDP
jgi:eukaryotic-like serine/threonine-protein kinase